MCETFKINFRGKSQTFANFRLLIPNSCPEGERGWSRMGGLSFVLGSLFPPPRTSLDATPH